MSHEHHNIRRGGPPRPVDPLVRDSIAELVELEREARVRAEVETAREARERRARAEAEKKARELGERMARARSDAEARDREGAAREAERETRLQRRLSRAMAEAASIAAAQRLELEESHRQRMEALSREHALERTYWASKASAKRWNDRRLLAALATALGVLAGILFVVAVYQPMRDARASLHVAATYAATDQPVLWDDATRLVAVVRARDPGNAKALEVEQTIAKKRRDRQELQLAEREVLDEEIAKAIRALESKLARERKVPAPKAHPPANM